MEYNYLFVEREMLEKTTADEVKELFQRFQNEDRAVRDIIIRKAIRLAIHQALEIFKNTTFEKQELVSVGLIGLIKSVDTFNLSKNLSFSTYARACIKNEILMFINKEKKHTGTYSLNCNLGNSKYDEEVTLEDILPDTKSDIIGNYEEKEEKLIIRKLVGDLPERDREIIKLYFGFINDTPLSQKDIAEKFNISQSYVSRVLKNSLKQIRMELKEQGIIEKPYQKKKKCSTKKTN